jgi:hypothetical protein
VPAAPLEYLGHAKIAPQQGSVRMLKPQSLEGRRTAIPVLLVSGLMFGVAGALKFVVGEESPIYEFPNWMPIVMFCLSGVLLVLAILNMFHVGNELSKLNTRAKTPQ